MNLTVIFHFSLVINVVSMNRECIGAALTQMSSSSVQCQTVLSAPDTYTGHNVLLYNKMVSFNNLETCTSRNAFY